MATHPKVLGLTFDPKLTYSTYIHNISVQAHNPLQMIKGLTSTGWDKQKDTLMATYKTVMRQALEYGFFIWLPPASSTIINKLQVMQNAALSIELSWRSGKRPRLRARRVKVRFSLRAIILSLENLNVIIRAIN